MKRNNLVKIGKTILSAILIVSLILENGVFSNAKKDKREESVYVNADSEGECLETTITEHWVKEDTGEIMEEKTYEGNREKKLPVDVSFSYQLDGKSVKPEEMAGKSGTVRIRVSYANHSFKEKKIDGKKEKVCTPFFMATLFSLPAENFSDVKIDHGKVINQDDTYMVLGYGLPGMYDSLKAEDEDLRDQIPDSFTITAETTKFELNSTLTYASPEIFSEFDLENGSFFDEVEQGLNTLTDSSGEIVKGSKKMKESLQLFHQEFVRYAAGVKEMYQGNRKAKKAGNTLQRGICSYVSGVDSLTDGMENYVTAAKQVTDGVQELYRGIRELPASYTAFSTGLKNYTAAVDEMAKQETVTSLKNGASGVVSGIEKVNAGLTELEGTFDSYATTIATIREQADLCEDDGRRQILMTCVQELESLSEGQKEKVKALKASTSSDQTLKSQADNLSTGITQMLNGISALSEKSETLRSVDNKMATGISVLDEKGKVLSEGSRKVSQSNAAVTKGVKKVKKAGKTLIKGGKALKKGMNKLNRGSASLYKSTKKMNSGVGALKKGAVGLSNGVSRFDETGIRKLDRMYRKDFLGMKERLSAMIECAKEYTAFSGTKQEGEGKVRFIIETEAVKAEQTEITP